MGVFHVRHPPPAGSSESLSDVGAMNSTAVKVPACVSIVRVNAAVWMLSLRGGPASLQETRDPGAQRSQAGSGS